jgi:hypothetical protein
MLIGHGIINRLLAKKLRSSGWKGPKNPGNNYWEYAVYEKALEKTMRRIRPASI